jgi:hypothetical protein
MAKELIVKLTDDLDGGDADQTLHFSVEGKSYEIDLSDENAAAFRKDLSKYVEKARPSNRTRRGSTSPSGAVRTDRPAPTLLSQLDPEEKGRFRAWAKMPTARRVADSRVQAWIDAGRP